MNSNILQVFYDDKCYPFKDKERTVRFPIVGSAFQGAQNTTQIKFYYDRIASSSTTFIAVSKLPNGKVGSKVLESEYDEELGENYALLELNSFYTQYKGDVYISLQGYNGGVEVEYDSQNEIYKIIGTPTIQATGSIKLAINYATQFVGSGEEENADLQALAGLLGTKMNTIDSVYVVNDITTVESNYENYEDGQVFYALTQGSYYRLDSGVVSLLDNGILGSKHALTRYYVSEEITIGEIYTLTSESDCILKADDYKDLYCAINTTPYGYKIVLYNQYNRLFYIKQCFASETLADVVDSEYEVKCVDQTNDSNKLYGTTNAGAQTTLDYGTTASAGNIVQRDSNGQIIVPQAPTDNAHATSKKYVDDSVASAISSVYRYKGSKTVAEINALTNIVTGDVYNVSDSGTLTGNVVVVAGDNVAWNGSGWDRLAGDYVPSSRTIAGINLKNNITKEELYDALDIDIIDAEFVKIYGKVYKKTDNLLDISIISKWYPYNYGGTNKYAVHSELFPVQEGETYYFAINNVDLDRFGSQFRLLVNILDENGDSIDDSVSYASGSTTDPHRKIVVPSGGVNIVATLSTRDYDNNITPSDIKASNMIAYLGKRDIVADELYNKYISPIPEIVNNITKVQDATIKPIIWQNATIDSSSGRIYPRNDRICSGLLKANISSVECLNNYNGLICYYDESFAKISITSFTKNFKVNSSNFPQGTKFVAIALNNSTSSISPTEGENCIVYYSTNSLTKKEDDFPYTMGSSNQIARLGWSVYSQLTPPEQQLPSYNLAYRMGCRIMLCDVRTTLDGKFVCFHDDDLGYELNRNIVRNTDGTNLTTEEKRQLISSLTLSQLDDYDFGIYKGSEYAGTKILRLDDFLQWCAFTNCYPMLEIKVTLTEAQIQEIASMCKKYHLMERVIIADGYTSLPTTKSWWIANFPKCTCVVRGAQSDFANRLLDAITFVIAGIETYMYFTDTTLFTDEYFNQMYNNGIGVGYSEIESENNMLTFYNSGYVAKTRLIASSYINIQQWLLKKVGIK